MRILAFSDLHRDKEASRAIVAASSQADVVVGAGDFGTAGEGLADTIDILRAITIPTVIVAGNHDNLDELHLACQPWESVTVLHGGQTVVNDTVFFGLGMEVPQKALFHWNSYMSEDDAARALSNCPVGAVLVTHSPPFGGPCDLQANGAHDGSRAIKAAIADRQPRFSFCGHIHHSWGTEYEIGRCRVVNLGPSLNWFDV